MTRLLACLGLALAASLGHAQGTIPPITDLKVKPNDGVFKSASRDKPLVLKSAEDAAGKFDKDALEALKKAVDFKKQFVLVFAWKGSGGDKLSYLIAESFPEQIFFTFKGGLTRDLREHVHVYALRNNVRWGFQGKAGKGKGDPEKPAVRPVKFTPKDPTTFFTLGGQGKVTTLENADAVERLIGKANAAVLLDAVDFQKETLVFVSWTTSGPPDGKLQHEMKKDGDKTRVNFYVQGPPGVNDRGQRARLGADFFVVPRGTQVTIEAKER
jgi:hypothetical protein